MNYLGDFVGDETVPVFFDSFNGSGASASIAGLAVTDIEIYKDGSITQRASDAGYTLLDTDGIDFDGLVGINGFSVDLSDNTTAGFFAVGSDYTIVVSSVTLESQTVSFIAASFSIQNRFMRGTDSAALASVATETRLAELDAGNLPADNAAIIAAIAALNDLSAAAVNAEVDTALIDYDGPTNTELVARTLEAGPLAQLSQNLDNCITGTASGTPTTTTMVSSIAVTVDDQFKGRIITFDDDTTTAGLRKQATDITGCTAASNTLTFTLLTTAPASGDTFVIT